MDRTGFEAGLDDAVPDTARSPVTRTTRPAMSKLTDMLRSSRR
ncbi:hypothetical protein AB0N89_21735 [Amycolatopsis sp. NPDC089917]